MLTNPMCEGIKEHLCMQAHVVQEVRFPYYPMGAFSVLFPDQDLQLIHSLSHIFIQQILIEYLLCAGCSSTH